MRKGLARSAPAVAALVALAGCGPPLPLALMPDRSSRPKQDPLVTAVRCGQAYAATRLTSVATATEISEAAVSACVLKYQRQRMLGL
jgi:predicted small lipoprotein YifL